MLIVSNSPFVSNGLRKGRVTVRRMKMPHSIHNNRLDEAHGSRVISVPSVIYAVNPTTNQRVQPPMTHENGGTKREPARVQPQRRHAY